MTTRARLLAALGSLVLALGLWGCAASAGTTGTTGTTGANAAAGDTAARGAAATSAAPSADQANFGPRDRMLWWTPEQQVAGYRNIDRLFDTRLIQAGGDPYPLVSAQRDFSEVTYELDGATYTLDDYVRDKRIAGLLVVKDGRILLERYALGNDEHSRWISFSIAKSVVSMLIGAAIKDGYIGSVDDPITRYLPKLAGGGYDGVSIKNVLQMASGVKWNEDYADPNSNVARTPRGNLALLQYMSALPREVAPGEKFNYNTGETHLAGALLRAAIGNNLSTYLSHKIWRPFGMESDATWMLHEPGGGETGGCCIQATLRDYARIGVFAMNGGVLRDGTRVLPESWMADSTAPSKGSPGYGYYWWLRDDGTYAGIGIFGQFLWIDPKSKIVIVTHSAWPTAVGRDLSRHRGMMVEALAAAARAST
ncbi:MAG TPA: serine hydrolase [Thermoanaerobaculia bacterium]|nr:serine hydrolase [Thermoanaerobaculia bacterium]